MPRNDPPPQHPPQQELPAPVQLYRTAPPQHPPPQQPPSNQSRNRPLNPVVSGAALIADIRTRLYIETAPGVKMGGLWTL
jgi:hypothetical protein